VLVRLDTKFDGGTLTVTIAGELDLYTAAQASEQIDAAIEENRVRLLVLDLASVSFLDSSGLGVILGRYKKIRHRGGTMQIAGASPVVTRILKMAFLDRIVPIVPGTAGRVTGPRAGGGGTKS